MIHTVGPVWKGGTHGEAELLEKAYRQSLALARQHGLRTVAFPSLSTGLYGYPLVEAAPIALAVLLEEAPHFDTLYMLAYDETTYQAYLQAWAKLTGRPYPSG